MREGGIGRGEEPVRPTYGSFASSGAPRQVHLGPGFDACAARKARPAADPEPAEPSPLRPIRGGLAGGRAARPFRYPTDPDPEVAADQSGDNEVWPEHDLWGAVQMGEDGDILPKALLDGFSDQDALIQDLATEADAEGSRAWSVTAAPVQPSARARHRAPEVLSAPAPPPTVRRAPASPPDEDVVRGPRSSRLSVSDIRTSSIVVAATGLVVLGVAARWVSGGGNDQSWSSMRSTAVSTAHVPAGPPYTERPSISPNPSTGGGGMPAPVSSKPHPSKDTSSPTSVVTRPLAQEPVIVPLSSCPRFTETRAKVGTVTISVQNACQ
jgi:hypothetical protein